MIKNGFTPRGAQWVDVPDIYKIGKLKHYESHVVTFMYNDIKPSPNDEILNKMPDYQEVFYYLMNKAYEENPKLYNLLHATKI